MQKLHIYQVIKLLFIEMTSTKSTAFVSDIKGSGEYAIKRTGTCGQDRTLNPFSSHFFYH